MVSTTTPSPTIRLNKQSFRLWRAIRGSLADLIRILGLKSLLHIRNQRQLPEGPKPVERKSLWRAITRSTTHLIPITILGFLLFVNYRVTYYGPGLSVFDRYDALYFALFQIAAKGIELVCVASLATILLEILRHDLLHDDGIPLGLLASALWFSSPIQLLSPEYLTALQHGFERWLLFLRGCTSVRKLDRKRAWSCWRITRLILLLFMLGFLATLIGPSSAVLLIPRDQSFPAGGTPYYLEATADEMWPDIVSADLELGVCSLANATQYPVCPSGGYGSFRYTGGYNGVYDTIYFQPGQTADSSIHFISTLVLDAVDIVPAMLSVGVDRNGQRPWMPTHIAMPNVYSIVVAQQLYRDWQSAVWSDDNKKGFLSNAHNYRWATAVDAFVETQHPSTHVRCSVAQNLSSTADSIGFHYVQSQPIALSGTGWSQDNVTKPVNIAGLDRTPTSFVRTQWLALETEEFGPVSAGLLFEMPWTSLEGNGSRLAMSCTIAASWAQSIHGRSETSNYFAWSTKYSDSYNKLILNNVSATDPSVASYSRHIKLSLDWLNLLTPAAPDPIRTDANRTPTTLENVFSSAGFDTVLGDLRSETNYLHRDSGGCEWGKLEPNLTDLELWNYVVCGKQKKSAFVERTIARFVSDGLARRLSYRAYNYDTAPNLGVWIPIGFQHTENYNKKLIQGGRESWKSAINMRQDPTWTTGMLKIAVKGFGYNPSGRADHLATAVVVGYLLLGFSHVVWSICYKRITSSAWDSAMELVLLAWNTRPAPILRGTSAQVANWKTYKHIVKIRAEAANTADHNSQTELHLQLLIHDEEDDSVHHLKRKEGRPASEVELLSEPLDPAIHLNEVGHLDQMREESCSCTIVRDYVEAMPEYLEVEPDKKYF